MLSPTLRRRIVALMNREVVPAVGCTEPVAVALCAARAVELLGCQPEKVVVALSGNMLKNAMGVGIPGTGGMIGLPIAVALGATMGRSEKGLEVLEGVTPEQLAHAKQFMDEGRIEITHAADAPDKLYISVVATAGDHEGGAVISGSHTHFIHCEHDHCETLTLADTPAMAEGGGSDAAEGDPRLSLALVWEFATETPLDELRFILKAKELNEQAAQTSLRGSYGHCLGSTLASRTGRELFGDTPVAHIMAATAGACDARMAGLPIAVMSNSGSGNQGITATMPVVAYAADCHASEEQLIRALALSHLMSIYIKQSLGRLSALCGCVVASTGSSCGITYLMGGGYPQICAAVKNMIANLAGMLCDGAKPSCAMKVCSGVSTALVSAMLAMQGQCCTSAEGIVADDVDATVRNLTSIGRDAMTQTDRLVLQIMTSK